MKYVLGCDVCDKKLEYENPVLRLKPGAKVMIKNPDCPHSWFTVLRVGLTGRATAGSGKKAVDKEIERACAGLKVKEINLKGHKLVLGTYRHNRSRTDSIVVVGGDTPGAVRAAIQRRVAGHVRSASGFGANAGDTDFWCETEYYETDADLYEIALGFEHITERAAEKCASRRVRRLVFVRYPDNTEREFVYWDRRNGDYVVPD